MYLTIRQLSLLTLVALAMVFALSLPATAAPVATTSANCSLSVKEQRGGLGATYTTSLKVGRVSCAFGKSVVKKFNACRRARGGAKGKCSARIRGLKCSERRRSIRTQFNSRTTCKSGKKSVVFSYTQFT